MEEEEAFDMDSDGSEESSSRVPLASSANTPSKVTTSQTGSKITGTGRTFTIRNSAVSNISLKVILSELQKQQVWKHHVGRKASVKLP